MKILHLPPPRVYSNVNSKRSIFRTGRVPFFVALFIVGCIAPASVFSQELWKLQQEKKGISLYEKTPSQNTLTYYKAVFSVAASVQTCASILYHPEYHPAFMDGIKSSQLLRRVNDTSLYIYHVIDLPWPISNRDMVTHVSFDVAPKAQKLTVKLKSAPDKKEPTDMIRAIVPEREWLFERTSGAETFVTYHYIADTGNLPNFLQEAISIDGPLKMLEKFRRLAEQQHSSAPKLAWMEE